MLLPNVFLFFVKYKDFLYNRNDAMLKGKTFSWEDELWRY